MPQISDTMIVKERLTPIPEGEFPSYVKRGLARAVRCAVRRYFKDPENRKAFEEWHLATYGESYVWKYEENQMSDDLR